jgi:hypothetical protein
MPIAEKFYEQLHRLHKQYLGENGFIKPSVLLQCNISFKYLTVKKVKRFTKTHKQKSLLGAVKTRSRAYQDGGYDMKCNSLSESILG